MMKKTTNHRAAGKGIVFAAVLLCGLFMFFTFQFIKGVKKQLHAQSMSAIMEAASQGCNTLRVQLLDHYHAISAVSREIRAVSAGDTDQLEMILQRVRKMEDGVILYLEDGSHYPADIPPDPEVIRALPENGGAGKIVDPHINSGNGVRVFNQIVGTTLSDGTKGYLIKEYQTDSIIDTFTPSFYNGAGFSFVINSQGEILICPSQKNPGHTDGNLFETLSEPGNRPDSLLEFKEALKNRAAGWNVFTYQGEKTVFCYTPLKLDSDWYLLSVIPERVVNAHTNEIARSAMILITCIIVGNSLLMFLYFINVNKSSQKLSNQADYIQHLYHAGPEGVALFGVGADHRLLRLNKEGIRLLGYPDHADDSLISSTYVKKLIHPEERDEMLRMFDNALEGEKIVIHQVRLKKADGSYFWASGILEKILDENASPIFILAFHDITTEKQEMEVTEREKLQERLTLVSAISNAYPVIVNVNLTKDTLNFIYVQPDILLDLGHQKTYSGLFEELLDTFPPENREDYERQFGIDNLRRTLGKDRKVVFLETQQKLSDGQYHWTSIQIIYVDNPYSEDQLAIMISRRIDEQKHEEEQRRQTLEAALDNARAASEAKTQFLSSMSHDIRTPMNAIVGMTAVAAAHVDEKDRVLECLKKISFSSKHLLSLINDILDMSKIESGKLSLANEPFNFAETAADAAEFVRIQAREKQITMEVHLAMMRNEEVVGDSLRIRQVLINILSNAVKFTPAGGKVVIDIHQEDSTLRGYQNYVFCCSDTGVGMSGEFIKRLFQPFERAQDSTASKVGGTGLGMAITKNLVDLMNGDILVDSDLGKGSVFTVTIPLKKRETGGEEVVPDKWLGVRTMIVDDDLQTCENAAGLLEHIGLRAEYTTNGKEAIRRVGEAISTPDPFRMMIVDWKMPDMGGVEVTRRIREEVGPEFPVIVLTAYDWTDIEGEAKEAGVTAFISKPFYRSKLCYLLDELDGEENTEVKAAPDKVDYSDKRILLVEDNEINREIARELIGDLGLRIEEACDGKEALDMVERTEPGYYDLILMDVQMPVMDGYESTRRIRSLDRADAGTIPILAMTANAFEDDIRAALRAGMNAHISKPINMETLEGTLRQYLFAG